jgi:archaellum component FlaC
MGSRVRVPSGPLLIRVKIKYISSMKENKLSELSNRLIEIPDEMKSISIQLIDSNDKLSGYQENLTDLEGRIKIEISEELDEKGKKVFSNAESREIEFLSRSNDDIEISDLKDTIRELKRSIDLLKIDYEKLSSDQRNIRSLLYFYQDRSVD